MNVLLMLAGVLTAGMGLKGFLFSSHFIDGGVTGICMNPTAGKYGRSKMSRRLQRQARD